MVGAPAGSCPATVLAALGRVAQRIYHQGVSSERTGAAFHLIDSSSQPARSGAARRRRGHARAARTLVAAGRITNLRVLRGGRVLADVGGPAVAPLRGTLKGAGGQAIGSYVTSVWADEGLIDETNGVTGGRLALRVAGAASAARSRSRRDRWRRRGR